MRGCSKRPFSEASGPHKLFRDKSQEYAKKKKEERKKRQSQATTSRRSVLFLHFSLQEKSRWLPANQFNLLPPLRLRRSLFTKPGLGCVPRSGCGRSLCWGVVSSWWRVCFQPGTRVGGEEQDRFRVNLKPVKIGMVMKAQNSQKLLPRQTCPARYL